MTDRFNSAVWFALATLTVCQGCSGPALSPWHTERLKEEFTAKDADSVTSLADYLLMEDRVFQELDDKVYAQVETGPAQGINRYSAGSAADPRNDQPDWNRSFELKNPSAPAAVLLLHGMTDSPYSLRALAEELGQRGYWVLGLRLPGHGTAPSGIRYVRVEDMTAAVQLAMEQLGRDLSGRPIHMVGYSTGATLALNYALDARESPDLPKPASLVLVSPAIRIHSAAAFASVKQSVSNVPGFRGMAWLQIEPEFDPYKYNSFPTNAADVVHRTTRSTDSRIVSLAQAGRGNELPPILVFKSTVDDTVTTDAVVDNLLGVLPPGDHELVLFDINRSAAKSALLVSDPAPLTDRLMKDDDLPFSVTLISNENPESERVVALHKAVNSAVLSEPEPLNLEWPRGVLSLSHVALPFPPDDPLYGREPPESRDRVFLGATAVRGERGVLALPSDWLLRMRYNPFYPVMEQRILDWLDAKSGVTD